MIKESLYDWIVIGGGVSGIAISEILCREGKSVLLLEKNQTLASETSKDFHEWVHSGALYTLAPDNLLTLRYFTPHGKGYDPPVGVFFIIFYYLFFLFIII